MVFVLGKVIVTALPPIETKGLKIEDMDDLMARTHAIMSKTFDESSIEVKALSS